MKRVYIVSLDAPSVIATEILVQEDPLPAGSHDSVEFFRSRGYTVTELATSPAAGEFSQDVCIRLTQTWPFIEERTDARP